MANFKLSVVAEVDIHSISSSYFLLVINSQTQWVSPKNFHYNVSNLEETKFGDGGNLARHQSQLQLHR
jgi:hypothetical protein